MPSLVRAAGLAALALAAAVAGPAGAQTVKIGVVTTFTGPQASYGDFTVKAMRLYEKLHAKELPPGVKIELITRDDGGPIPEKARQLAQELVVRDKVQILAGAAFTPNALAIAPIATAAKVPFVITNAATSFITTKSPYIVRFSFTIPQTVVPLGQWAGRHFKTVYTLVSDFAPGIEAEQSFIAAYKAAGGTIAGSVRVPIQTADFSAYLQRVKDAHPAALMAFVPGGTTASSLMKGFAELGLPAAGVKLIGPGDIVPDEDLPGMGNAAIGVMTVQHYSAAATRPANLAFVAAWKKAYGANSTPNFVAAASWDAMDAIFGAVIAEKGHMDPARTMAILSHYRNPNSPRGPVFIDPATRDIVQNEYLRETEMVHGHLANVEIKTLAVALKDPGKAAPKP